MTSTFQVVYEPLAQKTILESLDYITEQAGEEVAKKWLVSMLKSIHALETLAKAFYVWTYRHGFEIRAKLVESYRVFFWVDDYSLTVHVIDVVLTARDSNLAPYRDQNA